MKCSHSKERKKIETSLFVPPLSCHVCFPCLIVWDENQKIVVCGRAVDLTFFFILFYQNNKRRSVYAESSLTPSPFLFVFLSPLLNKLWRLHLIFGSFSAVICCLLCKLTAVTDSPPKTTCSILSSASDAVT